MAKAAGKATALWVLRRLRAAGHQALFAGGCVRDMLLGRPVTDYDVATDASPAQVRGLFRRVLLVGEKFGVAMVIHGGRKVEVATFRSDLSYSDGRRPDGVRFSTPREDALRRDFTINGMFYDPIAREVIDYVGGRGDLAAGVVRTIGKPDERFAEDYLRLIRAVRFAVRLGFDIDPQTAAAVAKFAPRIAAISGERIFDELSKMLSLASAAEAMRKLSELGLAVHILGGLAADEQLLAAAVDCVSAVAGRKDLPLTLAAMLAELPARTVAGMTRRWGASNDLRDAVVWLGQHRDDWRGLGDMPLSSFRKLAGHGQFARLRALWRVRAHLAAGIARAGSMNRLVTRRLREIPGHEPLPEPLITGTDLIAMGLHPGPAMGKALREAYDAQLNLEVRTRREALARTERISHEEKNVSNDKRR
jgi:poly(A) polymerase